jgi:hypothetical protein
MNNAVSSHASFKNATHHALGGHGQPALTQLTPISGAAGSKRAVTG